MKLMIPPNPFSAGTDFRRQNLTRRQILASKVDPRKLSIMAVDP